MNANIPYKIVINGEVKAELLPGEQISVEVCANDKVKIIMTWSGSKEITLPTGFQFYHIFAKGNLAYNIIGGAGAAIFFVLILVTNHFAEALAIKYTGVIFAIALMFYLLYMLTKGKWNWIILHIKMQS